MGGAGTYPSQQAPELGIAAQSLQHCPCERKLPCSGAVGRDYALDPLHSMLVRLLDAVVREVLEDCASPLQI